MQIEGIMSDLAKKDTGLGHFVAFSYSVFSNDVLQGLLHFVAAIVAGLFAYRNDKWNVKFIIPFFIIYCLLLIVFSRLNYYKKKRQSRYLVQKSLNVEIASLLYGMSVESVDLNSSLQKSPSYNTFNDSKYFEKVADNICVSVFQILRDLFGNDRFKVSVFQQYSKGDHLWVKMIAEKSAKLDRADSYQQEYQIDIQDKETLPFFCRVFFKDDKEYVILLNDEDVREQFIKIRGHKINTKQYIGVVGKVDLETVGFVLQICTYTKGQFGQKIDAEHFFLTFLFRIEKYCVLRIINGYCKKLLWIHCGMES